MEFATNSIIQGSSMNHGYVAQEAALHVKYLKVLGCIQKYWCVRKNRRAINWIILNIRILLFTGIRRNTRIIRYSSTYINLGVLEIKGSGSSLATSVKFRILSSFAKDFSLVHGGT